MPTRSVGVGKIAPEPSACIASSRHAILPTLRILLPGRYVGRSPISPPLDPRYARPTARETRNDATVRGHPGDRRDPRAGGAVRGLSAGGAGRRRDQGRASRRSRPEPRLRHRQGAQPPQHGHGLPDAGLQQALDRARPEAGRRSRDPQEAGRHRGCLRGELSAGAFEALGLGYDALAAINPRLIYASFSAFGQHGPRSGQTAYDHVIQATSGIMAMTGTKDVHPVQFGSPAIDYATGMTGAFALSAALFQRERTGRGQRIDMAMLDVAMILMSSHLTGYLRNGTHPKPHGNHHSHATNGAFATKDGALVMLGASNVRQQKRLWTVLGRPDMIKPDNDARDADHAREIAVLEEIML